MLSMCIVMTSLLRACKSGRVEYQAVCYTHSSNSFLFTFFKAKDEVIIQNVTRFCSPAGKRINNKYLLRYLSLLQKDLQ